MNRNAYFLARLALILVLAGLWKEAAVGLAILFGLAWWLKLVVDNAPWRKS